MQGDVVDEWNNLHQTVRPIVFAEGTLQLAPSDSAEESCRFYDRIGRAVALEGCSGRLSKLIRSMDAALVAVAGLHAPAVKAVPEAARLAAVIRRTGGDDIDVVHRLSARRDVLGILRAILAQNGDDNEFPGLTVNELPEEAVPCEAVQTAISSLDNDKQLACAWLLYQLLALVLQFGGNQEGVLQWLHDEGDENHPEVCKMLEEALEQAVKAADIFGGTAARFDASSATLTDFRSLVDLIDEPATRPFIDTIVCLYRILGSLAEADADLTADEAVAMCNSPENRLAADAARMIVLAVRRVSPKTLTLGDTGKREAVKESFDGKKLVDVLFGELPLSVRHSTALYLAEGFRYIHRLMHDGTFEDVCAKLCETDPRLFTELEQALAYGGVFLEACASDLLYSPYELCTVSSSEDCLLDNSIRSGLTADAEYLAERLTGPALEVKGIGGFLDAVVSIGSVFESADLMPSAEVPCGMSTDNLLDRSVAFYAAVTPFVRQIRVKAD